MPETLNRKRRGRPVLADDVRKDSYLGLRLSASQLELVELASCLCDFKNRGKWALSRLLLLASSVVKRVGVDPTDAQAVQEALEKIQERPIDELAD